MFIKIVKWICLISIGIVVGNTWISEEIATGLKIAIYISLGILFYAFAHIDKKIDDENSQYEKQDVYIISEGGYRPFKENPLKNPPKSE